MFGSRGHYHVKPPSTPRFYSFFVQIANRENLGESSSDSKPLLDVAQLKSESMTRQREMELIGWFAVSRNMSSMMTR
jgi:hypothetical protein